MRGAFKPELGHMPNGDMSMTSVLGALGRRKWRILFFTLLAFTGAVIFVNVMSPRYTGASQILLENRDNYFTRPDKEARGSDPIIDAEAVQSQVQAINSREIALRVIHKLKLAEKDEYVASAAAPSSTKKLLAMLGLGKDSVASNAEERILETYFEKILVFNQGKSRVIQIEFNSKDPELSALGANTIAEEYIKFLGEAKKSTTQGASSWLAQSLDPLRAKVSEAEAKVEAFRSENGLLVGTSNTTIVSQQLGELNTQMTQARAAQSDLQSKARLIREALKNGRVFETSEVVNNELVRRLLEQRVALKTQLALEERTLLAGHPRMKELVAQLNDLENQIRMAAERTARTMENDAKVAGARVQSLQAELDGQKKTVSTSNESEVQLRALEREARALRENYESYLAKYRDALGRDADAAAPADARIISRSAVPIKPTFPKKIPVILLVTLATLVLSCAIIITRQVFSTEIILPNRYQDADYVSEESAPSVVRAPSPYQPSAAVPDETQEHAKLFEQALAKQKAEADYRQHSEESSRLYHEEMARLQAEEVARQQALEQARHQAALQTRQHQEELARLQSQSAQNASVVTASGGAVADPADFNASSSFPMGLTPNVPHPAQAAPFSPPNATVYAPPQASYPQMAPAAFAPPTRAYAPAPAAAAPMPVASPGTPPMTPEMTMSHGYYQPPLAQPHGYAQPHPAAPMQMQMPHQAPIQPVAYHAPPPPPPVHPGYYPGASLEGGYVPSPQRPPQGYVAAPMPSVPPLDAPHMSKAEDHSEMLAGLADDLRGLRQGPEGLVIGCHAYGYDVGTTATSMALARQMSKNGTAIYVDLTGARVEVEYAIGAYVERGLSDVLVGHSTFSDAIQKDRLSQMHVLPLGNSGISRPGTEPTSPKFLALIDALVQTYDYVLFDAGPMGTVLDDIMEQSSAIVVISSRDDSDPGVARVFNELNRRRPGCVTIVVDEPRAPSPMNHRQHNAA